MSRLDKVLDLAAEHRLKDNLLWIVCSWSVLLGAVMFLDRIPLADVRSFEVAFSVAAPEGWGALFVAAGLGPLLTFRKPRNHRVTAVTLQGLVIAYALFSVLCVAGRVTSGGVSTPVLAYLLPAMVGALLAAVYETSGRKNGD